MERYTVVFLFNFDCSKVLLRKKNHGPGSVKGRLNGLGGKLLDELPEVGAARELAEESGLSATLVKVICGTVNEEQAKLYVFAGIVRDQHLEAAQYPSSDGEENVVHRVEAIQKMVESNEVVYDLGWMVPMCVARLRAQTDLIFRGDVWGN